MLKLRRRCGGTPARSVPDFLTKFERRLFSYRGGDLGRDMVISLKEWTPEVIEERTGLEENYYEVLGMKMPHIELYVRWMQETQQYKPATVSRRLSIITGFYRTCVPGPGGRRLCLMVNTDQSPPVVRRDPSAEPNESLAPTGAYRP